MALVPPNEELLLPTSPHAVLQGSMADEAISLPDVVDDSEGKKTENAPSSEESKKAEDNEFAHVIDEELLRIMELPGLADVMKHLDDMVEKPEAEDPSFKEEFMQEAKAEEVLLSLMSEDELAIRSSAIESSRIAEMEERARQHRERLRILREAEAAARDRLIALAKIESERLDHKRRELAEETEMRETALQQSFSRALAELRSRISRYQAQVQAKYGLLVEDRLGNSSGGSRLLRVDWKKFPQPMEFRVFRAKGVKNKLPSGRYVLLVSVYDRLGGTMLRWDRLGLNGGGGEKNMSGSTTPVKHRGRFYDTDLIFSQCIYCTAPPKIYSRPANCFVFQLWQLADKTCPIDRVAAWSALPTVNADVNAINGCFKIPLLRGDIPSDVDKFSALEMRVAADLDEWLANLYLQVVPLDREAMLSDETAAAFMRKRMGIDAPTHAFSMKLPPFDITENPRATVTFEDESRQLGSGVPARSGLGSVALAVQTPRIHSTRLSVASFENDPTKFRQNAQIIPHKPTAHNKRRLKEFDVELAYTSALLRVRRENRQAIPLPTTRKSFAHGSKKGVGGYTGLLSHAEEASHWEVDYSEDEWDNVMDPDDAEGHGYRGDRFSVADPLGHRMSGLRNRRSLSGDNLDDKLPADSSHPAIRDTVHPGAMGRKSVFAAAAPMSLGRPPLYKPQAGQANATLLPRPLGNLSPLREINTHSTDDDTYINFDSDAETSSRRKSAFASDRNSLGPRKLGFENVATHSSYENTSVSTPTNVHISPLPSSRSTHAISQKTPHGASSYLSPPRNTLHTSSRFVLSPSSIDQESSVSLAALDIAGSRASALDMGMRGIGASRRYVTSGFGIVNTVTKRTIETTTKRNVILNSDPSSDLEKTNFEDFTYAVNKRECAVTPGQRLTESIRKFVFFWQEVSADLHPRAYLTYEFWSSLIMLIGAFWIRIYIHYLGQFIFLRALRVPVYDFSPSPYAVSIKYVPNALPAEVEMGVVVLGPIAVIIVFGILCGLSWLCQRFLKGTPEIMSKFICAFGIGSVLHTILLVVVDAISGRYDCQGNFPKCADDFTSITCNCSLADAWRLGKRYEVDEGSTVIGDALTFLLYVVLIFLALSNLYMYILRLHLNGRLLDNYRRLQGVEDTFFVPNDAEVSHRELADIIEKSRRWIGPGGSSRRVAVCDVELTDSKDSTFKWTTTHLIIFTQTADRNSKQLYRHFIRLHDGSIIEAFDTQRSSDNLTFKLPEPLQELLKSSHSQNDELEALMEDANKKMF